MRTIFAHSQLYRPNKVENPINRIKPFAIRGAKRSQDVVDGTNASLAPLQHARDGVPVTTCSDCTGGMRFLGTEGILARSLHRDLDSLLGLTEQGVERLGQPIDVAQHAVQRAPWFGIKLLDVANVLPRSGFE
jgi:hypothetical protein